MTMKIPRIGDPVHYHSRGSADGVFQSEPRAAIITGIPEGQNTYPYPRVHLAVLNPTGMFFDLDVPHAVEKRPGCWTWPLPRD